MSELRVIAKTSDIKEDLQPLFIDVDSSSIGVYRYNGRYYAYRNSCPHQGGPPLEGLIVGNTECAVDEFGMRKVFVSTKKFNIACPWHGLEFDLETGLCNATARLRLKLYHVVQDGDDLKIAM